MSYKALILFIIAAILQCVYNIFITDRLSKREAKKAFYDCSNCQNWKCYYHYCKKQKQKDLEGSQ